MSGQHATFPALISLAFRKKRYLRSNKKQPDMFSDTAILVINGSCLGFMVLMLAVLAAGTKMKGGVGWAALVIVTTTLPAELANLFQALASDSFPYYYYPASFLNIMCMPSLWFFVRSQFDKSARFTTRSWLHLIPSLISFATYVTFYESLSPAELQAEKINMESGGANLPSMVNDLLLYTQMFVYFFFIFRYMRRRKRYLRDNYSDSDYYTTRWVSSFITAFAGMFLMVFIAFAIDPASLAWVIPILNAIAMAYLVFVVVKHSMSAYLDRLPEVAATSERESAAPAMSGEQMREICDRVTEYLQTSKAYLDPDFSIHALAGATDIGRKNISAAINGGLGQNFFEFINSLRVGEAKRRLLEQGFEYTADSVYPDCGFRSRSVFYSSFKRLEGVSPVRWLKINRPGAANVD